MKSPTLSDSALKSMNVFDKKSSYQAQVLARKNCSDCKGIYNPGSIEEGIYDNSEHIGPWTGWQGNLDAELMVIGQDWGGNKYFEDKKGMETDNNPTNVRLKQLLEEVNPEFKIEMPKDSSGQGIFYFTNAILCCREGLLTENKKTKTGPVKSRWFRNCENRLKAQIELVDPKVIVTLGYFAYRSVLSSFELHPEPRMRDAIKTDPIQLSGCRGVVVPVYHCGNNGSRSRSLEQQKADWKRVKAALLL